MSKVGELKYPKSSAGKPRAARAERWNEARFVQLELTLEQAATLKGTVVTAEEIFGQMERMIDDGYKFTVKFDRFGDCIGAWCQASEEDGPNSGIILTGRGSSTLKALKQLLYKHFVLLDADWSVAAERRTPVVLDD